MNKAIVGLKLGMSQIFTADGRCIPVTVVEAGPCPVVQKKTVEKDGYSAVQVAFKTIVISEEAKKHLGDSDYKGKVIKPIAGHYKKADIAPARYLKELKLSQAESMNVGDVITCDVFSEGDQIDVTGTTKGRGFTGTIQRWNTSRGPMAHGSGYHRGVGSMGSNSDPSRVFKNKRLPGHYGNEQVTIQNLEVVKVDKERNLVLVKGGIPGPKGSLVIIKQSVKV